MFKGNKKSTQKEMESLIHTKRGGLLSKAMTYLYLELQKDGYGENMIPESE